MNSASDVGQGEFATATVDEVEHGGRVDEGKQVVDLEVQFVRRGRARSTVPPSA